MCTKMTKRIPSSDQCAETADSFSDEMLKIATILVSVAAFVIIVLLCAEL